MRFGSLKSNQFGDGNATGFAKFVPINFGQCRTAIGVMKYIAPACNFLGPVHSHNPTFDCLGASVFPKFSDGTEPKSELHPVSSTRLALVIPANVFSAAYRGVEVSPNSSTKPNASACFPEMNASRHA